MSKMKWNLREVVMMSVLGVLFAAVYLAVFQLGMGLQVLLIPVGLSTFSFELVYGVWFMAATIAAYILRKPGAALITEVLAGLIELLMGNPGGVIVLITGAIQGAGCELGFGLFHYRKYNLLTMSLAGIFAAILIFIFEIFYLRYDLLDVKLLMAKLLVRLVSAVIFAGLIAKVSCDGLVRTGVLRNYAAGELLQDDELEEEEE